jgi:uncharacterized protein YjaZ
LIFLFNEQFSFPQNRFGAAIKEVKVNRYLLITIVIIISLLSGCVEERASEKVKQVKTDIPSNQKEETDGYSIQNATPDQFKVGEQEFEIVPVFEPHLEYIQKVRETQESNHKELFISTVIQPFRKETLGENRGLWLNDYLTAPINIEKLNESIILLDENYERFSQLIKESLEKSAKLLPGGKKTIYLFPFNPDHSVLISRMNGVTGIAAPEQFIVLQIAPQKYKEEMIPYTMAHEYHHTVYFEKIKTQKRDLIDYVLVEGRADSFANLIYPNMNIHWTAELPLDLVQTIWTWSNERRYSFNEDDFAEMRTGNRIIPQWSDYRIGYQIMQDFLEKNADVPINEWTFMDADEILEKSHFPQ